MIKIGCCGYPVSAKKYYEAFSLVELNRTFYEYPRLQTVKKWRNEAPEGFEFTVKAHQDLSHRHKLKLELAREPFGKMKEICKTLNAQILLVQTAASFKPDSLGEAERFFREVDRDGLTLVWETRGPLWEDANAASRLGEILERLDVPHVTDPFSTMPVYVGRVAYFRLHGLGERMYYYQYTNGELRKLHDLVKPYETADRKAYVFFNNLSMYEDAARFRSLTEKGHLPPLSKARGLDSVKEIISKTRYPLTRSVLVKKFGWRLIEPEEGRQIRLAGLLREIPSKAYRDAGDLLKDIEVSIKKALDLSGYAALR